MRSLAERGIEVADPGVMSRQDVEHESRLSDLRHGLLNHPDVIERLLQLAELRDACASTWWFADQWRGRRGELYQQVAGRPLLEAQLAYLRAIELTARQLDHHFDLVDLDRFASVIRERRKLDVWGKTVSVGHSGERYGRDSQRARSVCADTVTGAVESIARRLDPHRSKPAAGWDELDATRRKWRKRMRDLGTS